MNVPENGIYPLPVTWGIYDIFRQRCLDRGYDKFELGHLIEVDVTNYDKIDYPGILGRVGEIMGEGAHRPENRAFKKVRTNV